MIYEYKCKNEACAVEFEAEQSIKDDPLTSCPHCLGLEVQRLISSNTNFVLKGDGWYADGYSSKSDKKS
jgi:putative FmdB family regulatory protein